MGRKTTKYLLLFFLSFFLICFAVVAIYQNVLGSSKSFVENKARERFNNNKEQWHKLFDISKEINSNNKNRKLTIGYYPNRNVIEDIRQKVKNADSNFIENLTKEYPELYSTMADLDISYLIITDSFYESRLGGIPGKECCIVNFPFLINLDAFLDKKWAEQINGNTFFVAW